MTEALQDEFDRLKQRREDLKAAITAKKQEVARLQKKRSQTLEDQLRRVRSRLSSSERKLRTRRLIVLGSLMEKEHPPADLLDKLEQALDRDQDRALCGLPPRSSADTDRSPPASAPLKGCGPAVSPTASGEASTWVAVPRPCPPNSSASPSPSGPETGSPGTPPLPKSSSAAPTASWSVLEDSVNK